ncbi:MAG: hypothetical protein VSS75_034750 [Candidatus Parabeggiatoa sp.]|nr:hypothetical protein [Candidatus Parabeggiatoa sp.]
MTFIQNRPYCSKKFLSFYSLTSARKRKYPDPISLIIYSKEFMPHVKKFILEVKKDDSGQFFLYLSENKDYKRPMHKFYEVFDTISSYLVNNPK